LCEARQIAQKAGAGQIQTRSPGGRRCGRDHPCCDPTGETRYHCRRPTPPAGGSRGLLLGSISQELAALAPCTVIVVP
jgi:hypothetical protein